MGGASARDGRGISCKRKGGGARQQHVVRFHQWGKVGGEERAPIQKGAWPTHRGRGLYPLQAWSFPG